MWEIVIVDDDENYAERIAEVTLKVMKSKNETANIKVYSNPMELLMDLDQKKYYDIYLLDVKMPVKNGIEVAREIRKYFSEPAIIYITSYADHSSEAFEVNAFRYISKSQLEKKLPEAYEALLPELIERKRKCYVVTHYLETQVIRHTDIFGMKTEGKYVVIYHTNGESRVRKSLKKVLDELNAQEFIEVGKGYAVNIRQIKTIDNRELHLHNGMKFPTSKYRINEVRKKIIEYWLGK